MKLYKYMVPERASFFENWLIRFTQPGEFNDPFEMRPYVSTIAREEVLRERAEWAFPDYIRNTYNRQTWTFRRKVPFKQFEARYHDNKAMHIQRIREQAEPRALEDAKLRVAEMVNTRIGIMCLTEEKGDLLMWAHYAGSHFGFVIEFDSEAEFFRQRNPPEYAVEDDIESFREEYGFLRQVEYREQRPSVALLEMKFDTMLVKSKHWEYEKEWRMLMPLEYAPIVHPSGNGRPICLFPLWRNAVTKVILGANMRQDVEGKIRAALYDDHSTEHIAFERSVLDEAEFKLRFRPV